MEEYIDIDAEQIDTKELIMNKCNELLKLYGYIPEGMEEAGEIQVKTYFNGEPESSRYVPYDGSVVFSYDKLAIDEPEDLKDSPLKTCKSPELLCSGIPIVFNKKGRVMVFSLDKKKHSVKYDEPEALFNNSYDKIKNALSQTESNTHSVWADIMQYFSKVPSKFNDIDKTLTAFNRLGKLTPESNINDYRKSLDAVINATNRYINYKTGENGFEAHNKNGASDVENRRLNFARKVRQFADEKMHQLELVSQARFTLNEYKDMSRDSIKKHIKMEHEMGGMNELYSRKKEKIGQVRADPLFGHLLEYPDYRMEAASDIIKDTFNDTWYCFTNKKAFEDSKKTYKELLADIAGSMIACELIEREGKITPESDSSNMMFKNEIDAETIRLIGTQAISIIGSKVGVTEIEKLEDCAKISSKLFAHELIYNIDFSFGLNFNNRFSSRVKDAIKNFKDNNSDNSYVQKSAKNLAETLDLKKIDFNRIANADKLHDKLSEADKSTAEDIIVSMVMMNVFGFDKKLGSINAHSALNELAAEKKVSFKTFEQSTRECLPENMLDNMTYAGLFRFVSDAEKQNSITKEVHTKISGMLCKNLGVKQDAAGKEAEKAADNVIDTEAEMNVNKNKTASAKTDSADKSINTDKTNGSDMTKSSDNTISTDTAKSSDKSISSDTAKSADKTINTDTAKNSDKSISSDTAKSFDESISTNTAKSTGKNTTTGTNQKSKSTSKGSSKQIVMH